MGKVNKTQFAFWEKENGAENNGYWMMFNSLDDAASEASGRTIYRMEAKPIGKYTVKAVLVKVPQRKRRKSSK